MERTTLDVSGMSCGGCESNVIDALETLEGVASVTADHERDEVQVEHDAGAVDETALSDAVENAGYEVVA